MNNKQQNKPLFEKFYIEVSSNSLVKDDDNHTWVNPVLRRAGCLASVKMICNFPRCKKPKISTEMVVYDKVYIKPLFDYNGEFVISRKEYNDMVESCKVISSNLFPVELTIEIVQAARESCKMPVWNGEY